MIRTRAPEADARVLSYDEVADALGLDAGHDPWRAPFASSAAWVDHPDPVPSSDRIRALCVDLRLPEPAHEALVESGRELVESPALLRLLAHHRWMLHHEVPRVGSWLVPWGALPTALGQTGRLFHALLFLTETPRARRRHAELGIPDEVSIDTLSDLGVHLRHYHRTYGCCGFEEPAWMGLHFSGLLYRLGRLQFELGSWRVPIDAGEAGAVERDAPILDVHIPEIGPLAPEACDESIDRARSFFPRHFPAFAYRAFACWSWLLDPQLDEYLPASSNILRFQRRFHLVRTADRHDGQAVKFVFRCRPDTPLGELPQRTTLQRSIVRHLRAGRTWDFCLGYF